jgi:hypothetical protein
MSGRYAWKPIQTALKRRLTAIDHPDWVDAMAESIQRQSPEYFRWHDSGDLQSLEHLERIVEVCRRTPDTRHWLPTREYRIVADYRRAHGDFPENLNIRLSAHMIGGTIGHPNGLTISTVSTDGMSGSHECPSRFQGNKCGDCRACWDRGVAHVDYRLH